MPRYEYQCETCNQIFEVRATIQEKQAGLKPVCPNCSGMITRQIITAGTVVNSVKGAAVQNSCCSPNAKSECCR